APCGAARRPHPTNPGDTMADQEAAAGTAERAGTVVAVAVPLGLAAACWAGALWRMNGMDMGVATTLGSFAFFIVVWMLMMAAMMLPGAVPAAARRVRITGRALSAPLFAASYLAIWALAGVAIYAIYRPHGPVVAGPVVIA